MSRAKHVERAVMVVATKMHTGKSSVSMTLIDGKVLLPVVVVALYRN